MAALFLWDKKKLSDYRLRNIAWRWWASLSTPPCNSSTSWLEIIAMFLISGLVLILKSLKAG